MTLVIVGLLLALCCLQLFIIARAYERIRSLRRDLEIVGGCNDRLNREVLSARVHVDSIHSLASGNRFSLYKN